MAPPFKFTMEVSLHGSAGGLKRRASAIGIPDDVMEGAASITPPNLLTDTYAAAQAKMHAKVMRRLLLARYALRAAEQLADQMDDADGWNDQPGAADGER